LRENENATSNPLNANAAAARIEQLDAALQASVVPIEPRDIVLATGKHEGRLKADRVYIMTGFAPSLDLLRETGVPINPKTGIPDHDPNTLETPIPGLFIAGVVVAGYDANKVFIENGRFHGDRIVARLLGQRAPAEPKLSAELDT